jgi:putative phosphoribosyl transferase
VRVVDDDVVRRAHVSAFDFAAVEALEQQELAPRAHRLRGDRKRVSLAGRTALIVDDGIATGATARAACLVARAWGAARVVVAAPVAATSAVERLKRDADDVVVVEQPANLRAVGEFYDDFSQTTDDEVTELLRLASGPRPR